MSNNNSNIPFQKYYTKKIKTEKKCTPDCIPERLMQMEEIFVKYWGPHYIPFGGYKKFDSSLVNEIASRGLYTEDTYFYFMKDGIQYTCIDTHPSHYFIKKMAQKIYFLFEPYEEIIWSAVNDDGHFIDSSNTYIFQSELGKEEMFVDFDAFVHSDFRKSKGLLLIIVVERKGEDDEMEVLYQDKEIMDKMVKSFSSMLPKPK